MSRAHDTRIESYAPESWRPNQLDYCKMILAVVQRSGEHRIGLEGPCGCGKSIGYLRAAMDPRCPPTVVLSTTRQHLQQIEDTLQTHWPELADVPGGWAVLRGRSHYGCCDAPAGGLRPDDADPDPSAEWKGTKCPLGEGCRYRQAILACGHAKVVVQCTIGHLYRAQYWAGQNPNTAKDVELAVARLAVIEREVVILDEAHEYVKVRREFETCRLTLHARTWLTAATRAKLDAARVQSGGYRASYIVLSAFRQQALRAAVKADLEAALERTQKALDESDEGAAKRLMRQVEKLAARIAILGDEDEKRCISIQWNGDFADLVTEPVRAFTQTKLARVEVFTSATLSPVSRLLAIQDQWVKCFPEIFDWSSAVRLMPLPGGEGRKNDPIDAGTLESFYRTEGRPFTIALFFSRAHADAASARIKGQANVFVQGAVKDETLSQTVERAKAAAVAGGPAPFLITYGGWVGVDIPGAKWLVLGSVPKSPLSAAVEARAIQDRSSPWNDYERAAMDRLQLAQGLGRALRTPQDRAVLIWQDNQAARDCGLDPKTGRIRTPGGRRAA